MALKMVKKFDKFESRIDFEVIEELRIRLLCSLCQQFPRPWIDIYSCIGCKDVSEKTLETPKTQTLICGECIYQGSFAGDSQCPNCHTYFGDNYRFWAQYEPTLSFAAKAFKLHECHFKVHGCDEELFVDGPINSDKILEHEKRCFYQIVQCPQFDCRKEVVYQDLENHVMNIHSPKVINDDEWLFEGSPSQLEFTFVKIKAFGAQFYPKFKKHGDAFLFYLVMHAFEETDTALFKAIFKFCIKDCNYLEYQENVQPITFNKGSTLRSLPISIPTEELLNEDLNIQLGLRIIRTPVIRRQTVEDENHGINQAGARSLEAFNRSMSLLNIAEGECRDIDTRSRGKAFSRGI